MRNSFIEAILNNANTEDIAFLTGDLGFNALEPVRNALGNRFINCGIAEQNMVSVAAGLAKNGFKPWLYSIAAFSVARPFEQIRNDVCHHGLPVRIVGNGGGYGYGVQGPSHHALEDCAILSTLPDMQIFTPAFSNDLAHIVHAMCERPAPCYLRLGLDELPVGFSTPPYAAWRKLTEGSGPVVAVLGALAGSLWSVCMDMPKESRPELWCCTELPLSADDIPVSIIQSLESRPLVVMEEHVAIGGLGAGLTKICMEGRVSPPAFIHHYALGYPSGLYGSQAYHRRESLLDGPGLMKAIQKLERKHG